MATAILCFVRPFGRTAILVDEKSFFPPRLLATSIDPLMQQLDALPGVGMVGAAVIRAEIGTFSRFRTGKQLARYVGVSPKNCSSGERQADAGMIRTGNPLLKSVVIEIAHVLMRCSTEWKTFAHKLKAQGKPYSVITGAVANRWLRKLYYQMTNIKPVGEPMTATN